MFQGATWIILFFLTDYHYAMTVRQNISRKNVNNIYSNYRENSHKYLSKQ